MPSQKFPFEAGGPERLEVSWPKGWGMKNITVSVDGKEIGRFATTKEMQAGLYHRLDDGRTLRVLYKQEAFDQGIKALIDGQPLPGSKGDPKTEAAAAGGLLIAIGALSIIVGVIALVTANKWLQSVGGGWGTIVAGAIFAGLGLLVWKKQSLAALIVGTVLYVADFVLTMFFAMEQAGYTPGSRSTPNIPFIKIFFSIMLIRSCVVLAKRPRPAKT
jgi:hypothetical protein